MIASLEKTNTKNALITSLDLQTRYLVHKNMS